MVEIYGLALSFRVTRFGFVMYLELSNAIFGTLCNLKGQEKDSRAFGTKKKVNKLFLT